MFYLSDIFADIIPDIIPYIIRLCSLLSKYSRKIEDILETDEGCTKVESRAHAGVINLVAEETSPTLE